MKHGKKLTVAMKKLLVNNELDPEDYLCVKNQLKELTVIHKDTLELVTIKR